MTEDVKLSEYALLRRNGAATLVVALSGVNTKPGVFSYYNTFGRRCDSLLLNCPDNEWFINGVPWGDGPHSLEQTAARLGGLFAEYREVILVGGSMGAYGAVLLQGYFPELLTIAMAPEIYPGIRTGFVNALGSRKGLAPGLSTLFATRNLAPWIFAGEKKNSDMFCLSEIPPGRIVSLRNCHHQIPSVLHRCFGGLENFVFAVRNGDFQARLGALQGVLCHHPDVAAMLYLTEIGKVPLRRACHFLDGIEEDLYIKGYLCLEIARRFVEQGRVSMGLRYAEMALQYNPEDLDGHLLFAECHLRLRGEAPPSGWEQYINPHFETVPKYEECVARLSALFPERVAARAPERADAA